VHANLQFKDEHMRQLLFERGEAAFERPGAVGKQHSACEGRLAIWNPSAFEADAVFTYSNAGFLLFIIVFKLITQSLTSAIGPPMSRERYVIVGLAKTGTTAVAMTLRNTLRIAGFCMEPHDLAAIEAEASDRLIVKILFDHWVDRAQQLREFLCNASNGPAPTTIIVVRDPRDEAISRLHYLAYNYFSTRPTTDEDRAAWVDIFRQKEAAPQRVGLIDMQRQIIDRFGAGFLITRHVYESYLRFVDDILTKNDKPAHFLRYEDYVARTIPRGPLQALLSGSRDVGAAFQRVHRRGSSGDWHTFLTDDDLTTINGVCEAFLRRFGYPLGRDSDRATPSEAISHSTGSEYVERLITEARRDYHLQQRNTATE